MIDYCYVVGKVIILTTTYLGITYMVGILSKYMQKPQKQHEELILHILHYLNHTKDYKLFYQQVKKNVMLDGL